MSISLFDAATNTKRELKLDDGQAGLYVCGITPYDSAHLGHAFTYHVFDVLVRRLHAMGIATKSVRNVTDVDDDILRVARERGINYLELVDDEIRRFDEDMSALNLMPVDASPHASAFVPKMATWVDKLLADGIAYNVEGWVYFDVKRYPKYGELSRLDRQTMVALSRERGADPDDVRKRDPLDFVLWQPSAADEPSWPTAWGSGRPGWHIECTVMAEEELGTPIDIHGGGTDLIFPHHECEAAQFSAGNHKLFARHWLHVAMVCYQGTKMSKSLGNLVFVRDLLKKVDGATVRTLLNMHHYSQDWEYDERELPRAVDRRNSYIAALHSTVTLSDAEADDLTTAFGECIDDNLNTLAALEILDKAAGAFAAERPYAPSGQPAIAVIGSMLDVLGIDSLSLERSIPAYR